MPRPVSKGEYDQKFRARTSIRPRNSPGTLSALMPKKSLICVLAIRTAIPFVKPTNHGTGNIFLTAEPKPVAPRTTRNTPAIRVHMKKAIHPVARHDSIYDHNEMPRSALQSGVVDPPKARKSGKPATIAQ